MKPVRYSATLLFFFLLAAVGLHSQLSLKNITGKWRGEFLLGENLLVPFNFEIDAKGMVYLLNAEERFKASPVMIKNDSIFIPLDQFDNELAFSYQRNVLTGVLRKQDQHTVLLPATAEKGKTYRFKESKNAKAEKVEGTYSIEFTFESGKRERSVAIFKQNGKQLTGTFLKESGDSRYLQGIVEGNKFYLSSFIGSTPGYYTGEVNVDGTIEGEQIGSRVHHQFRGKRDSYATLSDPYKKLNMGERKKLAPFSFPDINGNMISLSDEKYKNKVVIIPVTGTWCPNCIDEAILLSPWYLKNKDRGVEIMTIHYERQSDTAFAYKMMRRFRDRFKIQYDQVFGGVANSDTVRRTLGLPEFKSYPTTLFIDKKGNIAKIHSGYSGPATGRYYDEFVKEFNEEIDRLLKE
jgi:thiol-disulfide isomerase/thioredoxin